MKIKLHNMNANRVFQTTGPNVEFQFSDGGQANVSITLSLSDGTNFHYPKDMGKVQTESTRLPPGDYRCVVSVTAVDLGTFGKSYDTKVLIGGRQAATAAGSIADAEELDQDFKLFVLRVA